MAALTVNSVPLSRVCPGRHTQGKQQKVIQEVLPKAGLVYSEKGAMSEMLCRPKILPIKSADQLEAERKETEMKIDEDEEKRTAGGGM